MGLELFAQKDARLPELTTVKVPEGVDSAAVRKVLLERHGVEIGAGAGEFASTVWRIGLMGHNARPDAVLLVLAALQDALREVG
jgi:alanine-glyoxylate transaminase/serine-glyoxylate transaminase/serine-pyruvate transaminase